MNYIRRIASTTFKKIPHRRFGGSHHANFKHGKFEPHISSFNKQTAAALMMVTYLWVMYRFKEDFLVTYGLYRPWEHDHGDHDDDYDEYEEDDVYFETMTDKVHADDEEEE